MNNLPDNCIDDNPSYPWNQQDEPTCPECGSNLIVNQNTKHCTDMECSECDYTYYIEGDCDV